VLSLSINCERISGQRVAFLLEKMRGFTAGGGGEGAFDKL